MSYSSRPRMLTVSYLQTEAEDCRCSAVEQSFLTKSPTTTYCGWKGTASYYNIKVDGPYRATPHVREGF